MINITSIFSKGTDLWLRKWRLIMTGPNGKAFTLQTESEGRDFRCSFQTQATDGAIPETAIITIYNLSDSTMKGLVKEFDQIILEAGYANGRYGIIFNGIVKQYSRGHEENMTESYFRIFAAHSDITFRFAVTNQTLPANSTSEERIKKAEEDAKLKKEAAIGHQDHPARPGGLYRGAVLWGAVTDVASEEATHANMKWSIQDGKMILVNDNSYLPGQTIDLNAETGLIGHPEVTDNGISVTSLLNPAARVRGLVKLNNDSINWTGAPGGGATVYWPDVTSINTYDLLSTDGLYVILVRTHEGDTRGNPWYTHMTCMAHKPDVSAAFGGSAAGGSDERSARLP